MEEAAEMCALLDSVDPSEWRKPPIFIRHPQKLSTYLARDGQTGRYERMASRHAYRFESLGEAMAVLS